MGVISIKQSTKGSHYECNNTHFQKLDTMRGQYWTHTSIEH